MIQLIKHPEKKLWQEIVSRPSIPNNSLEKKVANILRKVKKDGDKAIKKLTIEFDAVNLKSPLVTTLEVENAASLLSIELKTAIQQAKKNIELFHLSQKEEIKRIETMPGVVCWREAKAIQKVGLYIPGGTAPLFSTVLMLAVPAGIAGCEEIILCSPPAKDGSIHPAILYAAHISGVSRIFKVGGVQAIAAMAFGTDTIPKVFKIFGPGNQYVTCAKQLLQKEGVAIDMPAGPSEVMVIADESAVPDFVAADLLSQAEHGIDSQVVLVTTSEAVAAQVQIAIANQIKLLSRKKIVAAALKHSKIVLVKSLEEAIALSNFYAPEHLILSCNNAAHIAQNIISAGSVFIGNYSPESVGDYASGTNHTLPTNGYATAYSGVSVDSFVKKITFQHLSKEGLEVIGNTVMTLAEAEGLDAHKNAVAVRLKK